MISIIVPIFNSDKYLESTLKSIARQTYKDLEIILIDDGSTDNSKKICNEFLNNDKRFKYYYIKNSGPSIARNTGLKYATGKYIGFCDSDDIIKSDMYKNLLYYMEKENADIVLCDIYSQRDNKNFGFPWQDGKTFNNSEIAEQLIASMIGNESDDDKNIPVWGSTVRCLYKKEIIQDNKIIFPEDIHFAEDLVFTVSYLFKSEKVIICNKVLYWYRCNSKSIMNSYESYQPNLFEDTIKLIYYLRKLISKCPNEMNLLNRLFVTSRCYFKDCIGNACRNGKNRRFTTKFNELRQIVNNETVKKTFTFFETKDKKNKILYFLVHKKYILIILLYFSYRFNKKTDEK